MDFLDNNADGGKICPSDNEIAAYLDGGLLGREREVFERHLTGCPDCLAACCELRALLDEDSVRVPSRVISRAAALNPMPAKMAFDPLGTLDAIWDSVFATKVGFSLGLACVIVAGLYLGAIFSGSGVGSVQMQSSVYPDFSVYAGVM